jgi:hypothetical protein
MPQPFPRPEQIVERHICADTGGLTSTACPNTISELFIAGTEPTTPDVELRTVLVGGDGTCLAAAYTPPDQSRLVTFAVYPPEFRDWAIRQGIPQPPTTTCPQPPSPSPLPSPDSTTANLLLVKE